MRFFLYADNNFNRVNLWQIEVVTEEAVILLIIKKIRIFEDRTEIMKMTMTEIVQKGILQITGREARTDKKVISRKRVFRHRIIRFMDPGVIVFLILAVYLFGCMVLYLLKPHVTTYEVNDGSMATDYSYTGIAIRSEQVVNTDKSGYITYYARDLEKTGAQTKVYSIDETGEINSILSDDSISSTALTSEQLNQIDSDVDSFYNDFSDINYGEAYAFKQLIESTTISAYRADIS